MKYYMLASGSKGNACIVDVCGKKILIDCGTTKRYLTQSFKALGLNFDDIDAVLITHDHSDHTSQLKHFLHAPIYSPSIHSFEHQTVIPYQSFSIDNISVLPIKTSHDDESSVGYVIESEGIKFVYVTDTGYVREQDFGYLRNAHYYVFESNHDPEMLMTTARPYHIKQRILSDEGHLSNDDSSYVLSKLVDNNTVEVTLAHLSLQANTEELALETCRKALEGRNVKIKAARQFEIVVGGSL